jgi:hypothetical protein
LPTAKEVINPALAVSFCFSKIFKKYNQYYNSPYHAFSKGGNCKDVLKSPLPPFLCAI